MRLTLATLRTLLKVAGAEQILRTVHLFSTLHCQRLLVMAGGGSAQEAWESCRLEWQFHVLRMLARLALAQVRMSWAQTTQGLAT